MALFRTRPDGLTELDTDAGPLPVSATEEELRAAGHVPDHLSVFRTGATAQNVGAGGTSGMGSPPVRSGASNNFGQGGAPSQRLDQDVVEGAPADPAVQKLSPDTEVVNMTRETKPLRGQEGSEESKRKGPKQERIPLTGAGAGRGGGSGKGGMVAVGQVTKKGVAGLEDSLDRMNLQRQDEYRLERDAIPKQQERVRKLAVQNQAQITAEELGLEEERQRRERIDAELAQRQSAIDADRQAIEDLQISPRDMFHGKGTFAKALSAMLVLAAAPGQAYKGGENLAEKALKEAIDDEIAHQRERRANMVEGVRGKETQLDRLYNIYGTPEAAEEEFRLRANRLLQRTAENDAASAGADDALERLQARWAAKNQEFEQKQLELRGKLGDEVTLQERNTFGGGGGGGRGKTGKIGEAVRKRVADIKASLRGLDEMEAADNRHGNPTIIRTDGGFAATDAAQELAARGNALGPGVARATEGDAATKDSMDRAIKGLVAGSPAQRAAARAAYREQLRTALEESLGSATGDIDAEVTGIGGVEGEEPAD